MSDQPPADASILVISPVRNEAAHLERVARALAGQDLAPARWVVIDDGSQDGTRELLRRLEGELPFLRVIDAAAPDGGDGARDRLAAAVEVRNFNLALGGEDWRSYSHVMKLDGDIELPPHYLRVLIERFAADPRLGLAGGVLEEPQADGRMRRIEIPRHHVHGALKLYSRACFEAVGGFQNRLGWDTIDETYARMLGYDTRSYPDLVGVHHRPMASADGVLRGRARHGECAYIVHYGPLWVALRSLKVAGTPPRGISGAAFLFGYARAAWRRTERVSDPEFGRFTRRELRGRMRAALPPWAGRRGAGAPSAGDPARASGGGRATTG